MRPSHGDYKPARRRRYVPSGEPPRRRIPVIRVAALLALGLFAYTRFDDYWPRAREALAGLSPWGRSSETESKDASQGSARNPLKWSADSSSLAMDCPGGLAGPCCEALEAASRGLCGEATSLLARARWHGLLPAQTSTRGLRLEAQRRKSADETERGLALSALSGRDARGGFALRLRDDSRVWCDGGGRGCLGVRPVPLAPMADARMAPRDSSGMTTWTSASRWVRAALPGRVAKVDSMGDGVVVRLYHGFELYTSYGPLQAAPGVRMGAAVKAGSHLGDAPARGLMRTLAVSVRQGGREVDPAAFWGARFLASASASQGDAQGEATP